MNIIDKTDEEILAIAGPMWGNLINNSNNQNYIGFTKHFSKEMMRGANEIEVGKQWARNELTKNLSKESELLGILRRGEHVSVLYKQTNNKISGEFLGRLVLGVEDGIVKIFGATIF
ncbi:MAG: hypothetical protein AAEF23_05155 [Gammaproteobacteria bacterium]|jgi:hypothetical protein